MNKFIDEDKAKEVFEKNFIKLSRPIIKILGLKAAVMLCDLYSEYKYWLKKGTINQFGYFYSTIENVAENTGLSAHEQREAIKLLEDYGILKSHLFGMPAVRHFKILDSGLDKLIKDLGIQISTSNSAVIVKSNATKRSNGKYDSSKVATSLKDVDLEHTF